MSSRNGYSAKVNLTLKVNEKDLALSHVAPNEVSLRDLGIAVEPTKAQLVIQVDDSCDVTDVFLPNGIQSDSHEVAYF